MKEADYKVLMIDDDIVIAQSTAEYFNMFDVKTAYVTSYDEAVEFLEDHMVSLLLLDINLGENSGFDLCRKIRENYDMPILFVSARTSDDDVLIALNIGGDDYIKKPYVLSILLAKVKAILMRYEKAVESARSAAGTANSESAGEKDGIIHINDSIVIDTNTHLMLVNGERVGMKDMEYKLMLYLTERRGRVVTKDELLKNVWEDEYIGEGTIAVHIRHLREKTEKNPKEPEIIKTVWGVGYMIDE